MQIRLNKSSLKIVLVAVFVLAFFVRFYNYEKRITFGPEQAMSLITSGRMVTEKFTLLGNQNLQRRTSSGHSLFAGAIFNYSLIPLQVIFNYDPYPITVFFTLLNLFSGFVIYKLVKKMLDEKVAVISTSLFLFCRWSIYHSLFIWNQNYMFLIGIISVYLIYKFRKTMDVREIFLLGLVSGVGYTLQDLYLMTAGVIFIYLYIKMENKMKTFFFYVLGAAIPNLPAIVFDFRHDFYHIRTSFEFVNDSLRGGTGANLQYYHFLHLLPLVFIATGMIVSKIYKRKKVIAISILILFAYINLNSSRVSFNTPTGMPKELTLNNINKAAEAIANDNPSNFNVAVLVDFDTRGNVLRYPLEFIYDKKPLGVVDYPQSDTLYVLANNDYDIRNTTVWELSTFSREQHSKYVGISSNYSVFKIPK